MPDLNSIDWTGPATDIRDGLIEIWFARRSGVDQDGEKLAEAEAWADEMFEQNAR